MEMAVEYASDRKQFDRPIGAYQAVSHRCAQMLLEVEGARSATYYAGWAADDEPETLPLAASMAKAYASDAGWRVTASSLQVHGGIGFTWEHDLHFFLKRAKVDGTLFGSAREHRERVAELAGPRRRRAGAPSPDGASARAERAPAHELRDAGHALAHLDEAPLLERVDDLVALEQVRIPLRRPTSDSNVRSGAERPRTLVKIAIRPPGVSTAVIRSSARIGSANRCRAAKQQTASKLVHERQLRGVAAHVGARCRARPARCPRPRAPASSPRRRSPRRARRARPCGRSRA